MTKRTSNKRTRRTLSTNQLAAITGGVTKLTSWLAGGNDGNNAWWYGGVGDDLAGVINTTTGEIEF